MLHGAIIHTLMYAMTSYMLLSGHVYESVYTYQHPRGCITVFLHVECLVNKTSGLSSHEMYLLVQWQHYILWLSDFWAISGRLAEPCFSGRMQV